MRRASILVAFLAVSAGCVGLGPRDEAVAATDGPSIDASLLSPPVHTLSSVVETWVASHDGTSLHAVEYHPDVAPGVATPAVLVLSPYFGNLGEPAQAGSMDDYFIGLLVARGYTVVQASVRGTGHSGGCYELGGADEIQDAYELVRALHEADWSNGNVALIGVSYVGTTPWQAAATNPPGLKTIVPILGISDMYRYMFVEGAAYTHGPLFPTYYTTWVDGDHDAFWDERDYEPAARSTNAAVFLVHGLQDWNVDPDNGVPIFSDLPSPKKAWLGQWAHNVPFRNTYNEDWSRHDWSVTLVAWFDHFLKGIPNGVLDEPPVLVQDSAGHWHREDAWPPAGLERRLLYLAADGRLAAAPEPGAAAGRMGPYAAGTLPGILPGAALADERGRLVFTSEPLAADTLVVGRPEVRLNVTIDMDGGHLAAELYDAEEDDGPLGAWLGHAILDLAHREGRDAGRAVPPGDAVAARLTFFPLDAFLPAGHRLRIVLAPEAPDRVWPSPYRPTYEVALDASTPASFAFDVHPAPRFENAPGRDDVPYGR